VTRPDPEGRADGAARAVAFPVPDAAARVPGAGTPGAGIPAGGASVPFAGAPFAGAPCTADRTAVAASALRPQLP
jgi:hypothetical protein